MEPEDYVALPEATEGIDHLLKALTPAERKLYNVRMSTDPPLKAHQCAQIMGIHYGTVSSTWNKVNKKLGFDPLQRSKELGNAGGDNTGAVVPLRNVSPAVMVKIIDMGIEQVARAIGDPMKISKASLKDSTGALSDLVKTRALLKGEPTQIISHDQRANLRRLFPAMVKELADRGVAITIDGQGVKQLKTIEAEVVKE